MVLETEKAISKAKIQAVRCDKRLSAEIEHCTDASHPSYCPDLAQIRYFHDDGPDSIEALAAGKPIDFTPCDTASDDICLIAFTSGTTGKPRSEEHTSELQSLMRISYAVFCLKKKTNKYRENK